MSPEQAKKHQKSLRKKERKKIFRKWHRRLGFAASVILVNLAITGLLLNHYDEFGFHQSHVSNKWLLDWYDVKAPEQLNCLNKNNTSVCSIDRTNFLVQQNSITNLKKMSGQLLQWHHAHNLHYLISSNTISIYDRNFVLVDSINIQEELNQSIVVSLLWQDNIYFKTDDKVFLFDAELMSLEEIDRPAFGNELEKISVKYEPPADKIKSAIQHAYRSSQITHLKLLQDLHSGQLFFSSGKILTDLSAIIILWLAMSGFITWQRRINKDK